MSKGIAIQTILLLLVGILVVGILVYMVYRYFIAAPLGVEECRSRAITWCTACKNANGGDWSQNLGIDVGSDLRECGATHFGGAPEATVAGNSDCMDTVPNPSESWCSAFIPTS